MTERLMADWFGTLRRWSVAAALLGAGIGSSAAATAGITDPNLVIPQPPLNYPPERVPYQDPAFGTTTVKIDGSRPEYSELQAWNADMTLMLTGHGNIRDARTLQVVHTIDYGWPDGGQALRWSPVDPYVLYYLDYDNSFCPSGAVLMRYRLVPGTPMTRVREAVRCFPEYREFLKNESWEELSDDGRYIALIAKKDAPNRWGYVGESFVYDIEGNIKRRPAELPIDSTYGPRTGDHISMCPSGRYVLHFWASGISRFRGTEAYDLDMNYLGKVNTANTPHSALTMDAAGNDWAVIDNRSNAYLLTDNRYVVKCRIPVGVIFKTDGTVDRDSTLNSGATVPLLILDWDMGLHISGLARHDPGSVILSPYSSQSGVDDGWQPFEQEIVKLYLDSTAGAPHVDRLAHHRSHASAATGRDPCSNYSNYYAQPHATVSPDGRQVFFGSNWGRICDTSDPVDGFILTLEPASPDMKPPIAPTDLRAR